MRAAETPASLVIRCSPRVCGFSRCLREPFAWTEAQSRINFEVVSRLVVPGDPAKSPLLLHPLATEAGGDPTHTGGKFWTSRENPEWRILAAWVGGQTGTNPRQ